MKQALEEMNAVVGHWYIPVTALRFGDRYGGMVGLGRRWSNGWALDVQAGYLKADPVNVAWTDPPPTWQCGRYGCRPVSPGQPGYGGDPALEIEQEGGAYGMAVTLEIPIGK